MTIKTRMQEINDTKVIPLDFGEWTHFEVQGTDHRYLVHVPAKPLRGEYYNQVYYEYRPTCHSKASPYTLPACKGNSNGTVCKHVLAAIKYRVAKCDKTLSLPKNGEQPSAKRLLNLGGQLVKIVNQNGKSKWGVVR